MANLKKMTSEQLLVLAAICLAIAVAALSLWRGSAGFGKLAFFKAELGKASSTVQELTQKLTELEQSAGAKAQEAEEAKKQAEEAMKKAEEAANVQPAASLPTAPDDWATGSIPQLGLSFRYPATWGSAKVTAEKGTAGEGWMIAIGRTPVTGRFETTDFTIVREAFPEVKFLNTAEPPTCEAAAAESCEIFKLGDRTLVFLHYKAIEEDKSQDAVNVALYYTGNEKFPVLVFSTNETDRYTLDTFKRMFSSIK